MCFVFGFIHTLLLIAIDYVDGDTIFLPFFSVPANSLELYQILLNSVPYLYIFVYYIYDETKKSYVSLYTS